MIAQNHIKTLDLMSCMNNPFSGVTPQLVSEKLLANDIEFFKTKYLMFITSPEELGISFQAAGININQSIDFQFIQQVNNFIMGLSLENKQIVIFELDRLMVNCILTTAFKPDSSTGYSQRIQNCRQGQKT